MLDVTLINMSQFREGSLGLLSSHEGGMPVYCKTVFMPEIGRFVGKVVLSPPLEFIARNTERREAPMSLTANF